MAIREGRWDCPSCGSVGQLGRHVYCTGCGGPRPKEIRFYLPEDAAAVTDAGQLAQASAGAGLDLRALRRQRARQDARLPRLRRAARREHRSAPGARVRTLAAVPRSGAGDQARPAVGREAAAVHGEAAEDVALRAQRLRGDAPDRCLAWFGWSNRTRHLDGVVAAKQWERSVQVEAHRTVTDEGGRSPTGARRFRSYRAIRDYRQVLDHYETRTPPGLRARADGYAHLHLRPGRPRQRLLRRPHLHRARVRDALPHRDVPGPRLPARAHLGHQVRVPR